MVFQQIKMIDNSRRRYLLNSRSKSTLIMSVEILESSYKPIIDNTKWNKSIHALHYLVYFVVADSFRL